MARRRKKSKTRRKKSGISILNVAETVMLANVATRTLFNASLGQFIFGDPGTSFALGGANTIAGVDQISLKELFSVSQIQGKSTPAYSTAQIISKNFQANWPTGLAGMVLIPVGFKLGKNFARPMISRSNRLLNKAGVGSTVKL